jgi:hypothetical protein
MHELALLHNVTGWRQFNLLLMQSVEIEPSRLFARLHCHTTTLNHIWLIGYWLLL